MRKFRLPLLALSVIALPLLATTAFAATHGSAPAAVAARPRPSCWPGRRFAVTQTHWQRIRDGKVIEHQANRDDQGMAMQAGWVPPTPLYPMRCARATGRARRGKDQIAPAA